MITKFADEKVEDGHIPMETTLTGTDLVSEEILWDKKLSDATSLGPSVRSLTTMGDEQVLYSTSSPGIYAVDITNGDIRQLYPNGTRFSYIGRAGNGDLLVLRARDIYTDDVATRTEETTFLRITTAGDVVYEATYPQSFSEDFCTLADTTMACYGYSFAESTEGWLFADAVTGNVLSFNKADSHLEVSILCDAQIDWNSKDPEVMDFEGNPLEESVDSHWYIDPGIKNETFMSNACITLDSYQSLARYDVEHNDVVVDASGTVVAYRDDKNESEVSFSDSRESLETGRYLRVSEDGSLFADMRGDEVMFFNREGKPVFEPATGSLIVSNGTLVASIADYDSHEGSSTVFLPGQHADAEAE